MEQAMFKKNEVPGTRNIKKKKTRAGQYLLGIRIAPAILDIQ
jgi:ribosomal protein S30